jgi:hypothetical protein
MRRQSHFLTHVSAGFDTTRGKSFEMFGGARWMDLDSLNFGDSDLELDDEFAWEIGVRVNF